jgi:secondary thiamine-phosphate synthase enzyme
MRSPRMNRALGTGVVPEAAEWRSMHSIELAVDTSRTRIVDLTRELQQFCADRGDGLVSVFVPHATAGLALMETGSGSEADLLAALDRVLPRDERYQHSHGSPGHGADHLLPALVSPSTTIPVLGGRMTLGTWQSVVLVDLNVDNPRRLVRLTFLPG